MPACEEKRLHYEPRWREGEKARNRPERDRAKRKRRLVSISDVRLVTEKRHERTKEARQKAKTKDKKAPKRLGEGKKARTDHTFSFTMSLLTDLWQVKN